MTAAALHMTAAAAGYMAAAKGYVAVHDTTIMHDNLADGGLSLCARRRHLA